MKKLFYSILFLIAVSFNSWAVVSDVAPKTALYSGNGSSTAFSFSFTVESADDLVVILTDSSNVETTLTKDTDYTVSLNEDGTGSITTTKTYSSAYQLMVKRDTEQTQEISGLVPSATLESELDKIVRMIQENSEKLDRAILLPETESGTITLPNASAGKAIGWNGTGTDLTNYPIEAITSTTFDHIENYTDLAAAVSDIGTDEKTLVIDIPVVIADGTTVTIPSTLALFFIDNGSIDGVSGGGAETLIINGNILAGDFQIFGSNLAVQGLSLAKPDWWGAVCDGTTDDTTAVLSAIASLTDPHGGALKVHSKIKITNDIVISSNNFKIYGESRARIHFYDDANLKVGIATPSGSVKGGTKVVDFLIDHVDLIAYDNHDGEILSLQYCDNVRVSNSSIGAAEHDGSASCDCVLLRWVQWIMFDNVELIANRYNVLFDMQEYTPQNEDHIEFHNNCRLYISKTVESGEIPANICFRYAENRTSHPGQISFFGGHFADTLAPPATVARGVYIKQLGSPSSDNRAAEMINFYGVMFEDQYIMVDAVNGVVSNDTSRFNFDGCYFIGNFRTDTWLKGTPSKTRAAVKSCVVLNMDNGIDGMNCELLGNNYHSGVTNFHVGSTTLHNWAMQQDFATKVKEHGSAAVVSGSTYVDITHTLESTPNVFDLVPDWQTQWWITNIGSTTFRVNFGTAPSADKTLYWGASRE